MSRALLATLLIALAPPAIAQAQEIVQKGDLRVAIAGKLSPHRLPREGRAPVSVSIGGRVSTTDGTEPPALKRLTIAINRHGTLRPDSFPACRFSQIQPASTREALRACRRSLVGEGTFAAAVKLPEQSPFPSGGRLRAFNGTEHGKPVIFVHIYGGQPIPTSLTLILHISKAKGTYGTVLRASLPTVSSKIAYVSAIELKLGTRHRHSFVEAGCPAPAGFTLVSFPLAKASFAFAGGRVLGSVLERSCGVR